MKKISFILFIISLVYLTGCTKKGEKPETTNKPQETTTPQVTPPVTTQTEKKEEPNKPVEEKKEADKKETSLRDKSGAIRIQFPAGSTEVTLNGKIDGFGQKITYVFEAGPFQRLYAAIAPTDINGNIRINQIFRPSGKIDGPFGLKAKYPLEEEGSYKLVIGEDEMAGKPWKGEYKLTIQILK